MVGKDNGIAPIEVHWGLFDSPHHQHHVRMEWFWETAVPILWARDRSGKGPHIFGPEAQILHLCAHLTLHHGGLETPRLLWLHDIAEVLVHYRDELDWPTMLAQARVNDLLMPLQQVLPRIAVDWQAPLPAAVLDELAQLAPSPAEERIVGRLAEEYRPAGRRLWDDLVDTPSWGQRLRMAWVNVFPTPAYMRQRYGIRHPLLVPFYYPYRWFLGLKGLFAPRDR
jgi:hypothetical protein